MGKIAFVFAGQGAQYSGMGESLYKKSTAAARIFDAAEKIKPGVSKMCFSGTSEQLAVTANTQPCMFCVELAAAAALNECGIYADAYAGFSLGEIAALTASEALSLADGFRLVCRRGELMQAAAEANGGVMCAVLKKDSETVAALASEYKNIYPVNYNCPGQTVVSGDETEMRSFAERVRETGGKSILLAVKGAFHSPFMESASDGLRQELSAYRFSMPKATLYSNVTGMPYDGDFAELLCKQVKSPVMWQQTVEHMQSSGIDTFIEVGPGKVLSGLIKKILSGAITYNVENAESLENTVMGVKGNA